VKSEQVGAEQALEQLAAPGQDAEHLRRRKRDVEEEPDARIREPFAQQGGEEHQLIVVDPDRVARRVGACHRIGEHLVHFAIGVPTDGVYGHAIDEVVQQRPEHAVREAVVEAVDLLLRQEHREDGALLQAPRQFIALRRRTVRDVARPANPQPVRSRMPGTQTGGQPAFGVGDPHRRAVGVRDHGQPVGDNEQSRRGHGRILSAPRRNRDVFNVGRASLVAMLPCARDAEVVQRKPTDCGIGSG
jgi:hypothetical protein